MKNLGRKRSEYSVQAVINAMRILEALGESDHEQSLSELSSGLDLTKSNTNKLLATLDNFGYVDRNMYTNNFRLGVKTFQISQAYINKLNLSEVALPLQKELRDKVGESIYISVLRKENIIYLNVTETEASVAIRPRVGNIGPAYATASGKIQLAFLDERELEELYSKPFVKFTKNTIDSLEALFEETKKIRKLGYAIDNEEYEEGVRCIAAPIKNFMGQIIAAVAISAPSFRMSDERIEKELLKELLKMAHLLSTKFGYQEQLKLG